jgi:hypothetical protein
MNNRKLLKNKKDKQGKIILSAIFLAVFAGGFGSKYLMTEELDPKTLCGKEVSHQHIFLIDLSDKLREDTLAHLKSKIGETISMIPDGGKLEFYLMDSSNSKLATPVSSFCKPKSAYTNDLASALFENTEHRNKIFNSNTRNMIEQGINNAQAGALSSPISNRLENILLKTKKEKTKTSLYVVSDFMEHTPEIAVSAYQCEGMDRLVPLPKVEGVELFRIPVRQRFIGCRDQYIEKIFSNSQVVKDVELVGRDVELQISSVR